MHTPIIRAGRHLAAFLLGLAAVFATQRASTQEPPYYPNRYPDQVQYPPFRDRYPGDGDASVPQFYPPPDSYPDDRRPAPSYQPPPQELYGSYGGAAWSSIDPELQQVARDTLGDLKGAIVAIDPSNGDVRALWDNPHALAVREIFPPGSTFKLVTAAAALDSGKFTSKSMFDDPRVLHLPQTDRTIMNIDKTPCTKVGRIDLFTAVKLSCDTTFATLGMRLHEEIADMAQALGFNAPIPLQISTVASKFPFVSERNQPFRAYSGIGQGNVAATPLQMAIVAATIANRGEVVHPRMEREPQFYPTGMTTSQGQDRAMSVETATMLTRMMVAAVDHGTGIKARIPGVRVAGKTGTAQSAPGADPHVWFVAFAPATNPKLAVCVFVRNGGEYGSEATGGIVAAPMAKRILEADRDIRGW